MNAAPQERVNALTWDEQQYRRALKIVEAVGDFSPADWAFAYDRLEGKPERRYLMHAIRRWRASQTF